MMNNKKAVSPLIATVLLIAFAVALGAIVMNWGRAYVEDTQSYARESSESMVKCSSNVNLKLDMQKAIVDLDTSTPTNLNNLSLSLDNQGGLDIPQFMVKLYDDKTGDGVSILYNASSFNKYTTRKFDFTNTSQFFVTNTTKIHNVTQITIIPFITITNVKDPFGCDARSSVFKSTDSDNIISYT